MTITGTGFILLGGHPTGYVIFQDGSNTVVFHHRLGTALDLPAPHYDLHGKRESPYPGRHDFERDFRQALTARDGFTRR